MHPLRRRAHLEIRQKRLNRLSQRKSFVRDRDDIVKRQDRHMRLGNRMIGGDRPHVQDFAKEKRLSIGRAMHLDLAVRLARYCGMSA